MDYTPDSYKFTSARIDLADFIPSGCKRALDVGCSTGATGAWLKNTRGVSEVIGLEINKSAAQEAEIVLDNVIIGDIETIELDFPNDSFDLIIYADILEHLKDPWEFMKKQSHLLKNGGYAVVSLPNVANWHIVKNLIINKWEYTSYGTMDRTHLRFFTLPGMLKMFELAGYDVLKKRYKRGRISDLIGKITFEMLGHLVTFQYLFLLQKK